METLKKHFNFSDTISGTTFFVRWMIANLIQLPGGLLVGLGVLETSTGLITLGGIVASIGIALQFSVLMKRARALFSAPNMYYFYFGYLSLSILRAFSDSMGVLYLNLTSVGVLLFFLYSIFKNSGISDAQHLG